MKIPKELENVLWKETNTGDRFLLVFQIIYGAVHVLALLFKYYGLRELEQKAESIMQSVRELDDESCRHIH